jgi:peptidoglycan/LPS O-acetylase OafA/YrhL
MVLGPAVSHSGEMITVADPPATPSPPMRGPSGGRDRYVDLLRAVSLLVVVAWHWVFTVVIWRADGPHTSNPIGTTPGLWLLTWVLQVMPLFFFVGGFAHLVTWESVERAGGGYREFLARRLRRLWRPTALCLLVMAGIWIAASVAVPGVPWFSRALVVVMSPLWFLAIYTGLVLITPLAVRLHRAVGVAGLVLLAAGAVVVDVLRFGFGLEGSAAMANLAVVWAFAHQLGFWWHRLIAAPRRTAWTLALSGFGALAVLTNIGVYPRSMVGVPGETISNMGPPTVCILALAVAQVGVVLLLRSRVTAWLDGPGARRFLDWAGARSMGIYLWHFPAFFAAYGLVVLTGIDVPQDASAAWWAQRPLWAIAPALCTYPLLRAFRRFETRGS